MSILFVCTGNTCRSPMAEGIYNVKAAALGLSPATSAGIYAMPGAAASAGARLAAAEYGADLSRHRARQVTQEMMAECSAALCMTAAHAAALAEMFAAYREKIKTLGREDISDPYGGDLPRYRMCAASINSALEQLFKDEAGGCTEDLT